MLLATCCLAVSLAALAWMGLTGGKDEVPLQAQPTPPVQPVPEAHSSLQAQTASVTLPLPTGLQPAVHSGFLPATLVAAKVVDHTFRYVLRSDAPAQTLSVLTQFLLDVRFGQKGRSVIVRLLDGNGRLAWAAGHDGNKHTWVVHAQVDLAGCGPIWYREGRRMRRVAAAADAPRCRLEPPSNNVATTLLR